MQAASATAERYTAEHGYCAVWYTETPLQGSIKLVCASCNFIYS